MKKVVEGVCRFQQRLSPAERESFKKLAGGQNPVALFITCSDSRIDPNRITQTEPGDLFIVRNAGNIVPPHGAANGGEEATIEYAVAALKVRDVVVCGHTHCGAMKALISDPETLRDLPSVRAWLGHAEATRWIVRDRYGQQDEDRRLMGAIEENVLVQLENLRTHPAVAASMARGELNLHGWVYCIDTAEVRAFDPQERQFVPLSAERATPLPPMPCLRNDRTLK